MYAVCLLLFGGWTLPMNDVDTLVAQLAREDAETCRAAAEALSQLGEDAQPAAVALCRAAEHEDDGTREYVVAALEEMGPPTQGDVAELTELLTSDTADIGYWAATLLGRLGKGGAAASSTLARAVERADHLSVRERAAWALGRIGVADETVLAALKSAAESDDARLSRLASKSLEQLQQ